MGKLKGELLYRILIFVIEGTEVLRLMEEGKVEIREAFRENINPQGHYYIHSSYAEIKGIAK